MCRARAQSGEKGTRVHVINRPPPNGLRGEHVCAGVTTKIRENGNTTPRNADGSRPCNTIPSPRTLGGGGSGASIIRALQTRTCIRGAVLTCPQAPANGRPVVDGDRRTETAETVRDVPRGPVVSTRPSVYEIVCVRNSRAPGLCSERV